ncbi:MAG: UDP-3-O-(3-hydroxymyristoyl)glucosamine N-acyltransferase [Candidatus Tyrphobacter sp.]
MLGSVGELAERVGGRVAGDGRTKILRVGAVEEADESTLVFATSAQYFAKAAQSAAAAILTDEASAAGARSGKPLVIVENVRAALAQILALVRPPRPRGPFRDERAVVAADARVGERVYIGAFAFVGAGAVIGDDAVVDTNAYVGSTATIGDESWLHPHARVLDGCTIGKRVALHCGSVIGSEGFGWAFVDERVQRIPQAGTVVIEDDVEIGANSCVDRAQTGSTRIGAGTKIDNLVQVGHNCRIGRNCVFAALTGLAGSTIVGDDVRVGGQVGFKGHITVGSRVKIAGQTGVWGDVPDGVTLSGMPGREHRERLRTEVMLARLPKLVARVEALERGRARAK